MAQLRKPSWAIDRDRAKKAGPQSVWLFGLHAVRDALLNPQRQKLRLILTRNAADRLGDTLNGIDLEPEIDDPRRFSAPLDPGSVHQGAALEVLPLEWGDVADVCAPVASAPPRVTVLLDRVTDPHNVGAVLRSAEVFGASAVIAPRRHAAPETGALAKSASGALERQPYLRVQNLAKTLHTLIELGYAVVGLDGQAETSISKALKPHAGMPIALVFGAEGPGLRERTKSFCTTLARIESPSGFGSLNVSNAVAVSLFAVRNN
ncbi:MAG: RNA methyltransferase [Pseudomonadota bacterium]